MNHIRSFNRDFDAITSVHGDRPVFIPTADGQKVVTYEQLDELVSRHLAWFDALGLERGQRVGALVPNSVEMLALFIACLRGGFGFAPLTCDASSVEAEHWAKLVRPARVILGDILPDPVRAGVRASGVECVEIRTQGDFAHLPAQGGRAEAAPSAKIYLFTSGTTGQPKAIVLDGDRLWSAGYAFLRLHGFTPDTPFRIWNYLPHSYLGGLFNLCLIPMTVAGSVVVDEAFSGKTFLSYWQTVDRYDLNVLWLVPTIVRGLLTVGERTKRYAAKSYRDVIKLAFLGTAPIELATKTRFENLFGIPLLENYALSETTFLTSEKLHDAPDRREGSAGAVLPYVEFKFRPVADDPDPVYGEILVKTPFLFDGYLDGSDNVTANLVDGFFPTGDLGYIDEAGQLVVTGRCKDIIKKGGQLVSLREVEVLVLGHPSVEHAAAVPVAHEFYGESYTLFVKLVPSAPAAALDDVQRYVYDTIAKYKWPDRVEAVDEFQQTGSGKIRKFLLRSPGGV